jgi:hypothetical protein
MIRIPALDVVVEQDTLNRVADQWIPKSEMLRSLQLELIPGMIHVHIEGKLPLVGDRRVTAELSVELRGNELWLKLERTSVPLIPKAALVSLVVSQAKQASLRAEGSSLVLDLEALFREYEVQTRVHSVTVEQGQGRLLCLME